MLGISKVRLAQEHGAIAGYPPTCPQLIGIEILNLSPFFGTLLRPNFSVCRNPPAMGQKRIADSQQDFLVCHRKVDGLFLCGDHDLQYRALFSFIT